MEKTKGLFGFLAILAGVFFVLSESAFAQNWEQTYNELKAKIAREYSEPVHKGRVTSDSKDLGEYLHWMATKAADRNRAQGLSAAASNAGNPYWEKMFLDLMDEAHDSGESTLWSAVSIFLRIRGRGSGRPGDVWQTAVFKSNNYGKPLYTKAKELNFDAPFVREAVRCLMRFALCDVEIGYMALYCDRRMEHGTQYDDEGNLIMPDMDFDITCLPRSAFHMTSAGHVCIATDAGLNWVEQIRDVCKWFQLHEYYDATDLMNMFYKDSMCKSPPNKPSQGHRKFYGTLARQYHLQKSIDHNEGFYGTLYGKVEIETSGGRMAAAGAVVTVTAPFDGETWETKADSEGNYEIKEVILHEECSPFKITAQSGKDKVIDQYFGPLEEPDRSCRHEKNLLIRKGDLLCFISVNINWRDTSYSLDDSKKTETVGSVKITITGTMRFKINKSTPLGEYYELEGFKVGYNYRNKHWDLKPNEGCPTLDWTVSGEGLVELPEHEGLDYMRRMILGPMGNCYEFYLAGTLPKEMRGKKRKNYYCGVPGEPCECQIYEKYVRNVNIGNFIIRATEGKNGEMSGSRSWTYGFSSIGSESVGIMINEIFGITEYSPSKGSPTKEHDVNVQVSWNFEKLKK